MAPADMDRIAKPEIPRSACKQCNARRKHYVPKPEDVPADLQGLSEDAIKALRPFDIDVGPVKRSKTVYGKDNGYRQKMQMIRFAYTEEHPADKIQKLSDGDMRKKAKAAYKFLKHCDDSSYVKFLKTVYFKQGLLFGKKILTKQKETPCLIGYSFSLTDSLMAR